MKPRLYGYIMRQNDYFVNYFNHQNRKIGIFVHRRPVLLTRGTQARLSLCRVKKRARQADPRPEGAHLVLWWGSSTLSIQVCEADEVAIIEQQTFSDDYQGKTAFLLNNGTGAVVESG